MATKSWFVLLLAVSAAGTIARVRHAKMPSRSVDACGALTPKACEKKGTAFLLLGSLACAASSGFNDLFNGRDLTGWEGLKGFWSVRDGVLHTKGKPTGYVRTERFLQNEVPDHAATLG